MLCKVRPWLCLGAGGGSVTAPKQREAATGGKYIHSYLMTIAPHDTFMALSGVTIIVYDDAYLVMEW